MSNIFFYDDSEPKVMNSCLLHLGTGVLLAYAVAIIAVPARLSVANAQSDQRSFTCNTDGYIAQIGWRGNQPQLTFGASSESPTIRNAPVEVLSRRGIVTYTTQQGEAKTTVFLYSDGTCAVTITAASGETTVNELGQIADQSHPISAPSSAPDETLLSFQTSRNAVRIFTRNGETLMNIYDKQEKITWINGVPVKTEQTPEGTRYTNTRGEAQIEVFLNLNGDRTLAINGDTEQGY